MGDFILQHKKLSYCLFFFFIFYVFVITPAEIIIDNKNILKSRIKRIESLKIKNEIVLKNKETAEKEREKLSAEYKKISSDKKGLESLGEFQNYLNNFLSKYNIEILEIARALKNNEDEWIVPYTTAGKEEDILKFICEAEKDENINFMKGIIEFKNLNNKVNNKIIFRFSASVKLFENENKENVKRYKRDIRKNKILSLENESLKLVKYKMINNMEGIFYFELSGKTEKYFLKNNEIIIIHKHIYKVNFNGNRLIFKNSENEKNLLIFDLEEKIEKEN